MVRETRTPYVHEGDFGRRPFGSVTRHLGSGSRRGQWFHGDGRSVDEKQKEIVLTLDAPPTRTQAE